MTDDTLRAILSRVITEPGEDVHRLVYADALDERGQSGDAERAEFVRVSVVGNVREQDRLFQKYGKKWAPPLVKWDAVYRTTACHRPANPPLRDTTYAVFDRGFCGRVECSALTFLRHADALLWHPERGVKCDAKGCVDGTIGRPRPGDVGGQWMGRMCDRCNGFGIVASALPPLTAHPIRKVTLTTVPLSSGRSDGVPLPLSWFQQRWPGVEFDLPEPNQNVPYDDPFPDVPWGGGL